MSDKNDDFVSFENAMRELKLRSEELRKLVSQGDIRAKKEGASMKFKRQDVDALAERFTSDTGGAAKPAGDALEDDTGMVTEQISDEDTLLAEDAPAPTKAARPAAQRAARPVAVAAASGPAAKEPGWVTAMAIVGFLVFLWATMIHYSISQEQNPKDSMFTSAWSG
ncbi:MAG: helix-turn-helix domain-containing protein [Phycisphaerales bacterium]|nr:helix-turn-helix domain-containing protein [Phycisphaerales bacterium]